MLRGSESDTEILLGNKQLLGIFFVVAILLGIAFAGGYMVGRGSTGIKPATVTAVPNGSPTSTDTNTSGGQTHTVPPESGASDTATAQETRRDKQTALTTTQQGQEAPLGSPARKSLGQAHPPASDSSVAAAVEGFTPQAGQEFLQVGAVGRDEAEAVADVLHKKGFPAHAVPKPGNQKIYRVLIGPIRDSADLSSTRDSLRKTGFREVIVQKY